MDTSKVADTWSYDGGVAVKLEKRGDGVLAITAIRESNYHEAVRKGYAYDPNDLTKHEPQIERCPNCSRDVKRCVSSDVPLLRRILSQIFPKCAFVKCNNCTYSLGVDGTLFFRYPKEVDAFKSITPFKMKS